MNRITDYSLVSPLVMSYFKRGVITNSFLCPDEYRSEISEGRLFYEQSKDALAIYVKRDGFYRLYFHALSDTAALPETSERLVCDVSGIDSDFLTKRGFVPTLDRIQLSCKKQEEASSSDMKCVPQDYEEIYSLMCTCFDSLTGYTPCLSLVKKECENGLYYKYVKDGRIAGVLRKGVKGKASVINHLCVAKDFRGLGIGKALCLEFLKENKNSFVWTAKNNTAAIRLYKSCGFEETFTASTVYTKG